MRTALIDYGAGNLHSVHKALVAAGLEVIVTADPAQAASADALVLPGQGHFGQAMGAFLASGFEPLIRDHLRRRRPFLGICVGLQLLMESSEEAPGVPGLGLLGGRVRRFDDSGGDDGKVSVPQMGWNRLDRRGDPALLRSVPDGAYVYFANSYYVDFEATLPGATTRYGRITFLSALSDGPLCATQFHPEKSQRVGLAILGNFRAIGEAALGEVRS